MKLLTNLQDYRPYPAYNYSLLSALDKNPSGLQYKDKLESSVMNKGSLLDLLLTNPENFDAEFHIINENKPTAGSLVLYDGAIARIEELQLKQYEHEVIITELYKLKDELNLWSKLVNPELIKERVEDAQLLTCIKDHFLIQNKTPIYAKEKAEVDTLLLNLREHPFTKKYFNKDEGVEIMYQVPIVFGEHKALLDGIYIDHWNKEITPFDLKSTDDSAFSFPSKINRFRYDIQAALYTDAFLEYIQNTPEYKNYKINDFIFIVGSYTSPTRPAVYNAKNIIEIGKYGGVLYNRKIKGYLQLTEEYKWHSENNLWEYKKEVYNNNGVIIIDYDE